MIAPDRVVPTTCPYCGVGCNLELHIKDDYVYKVTSPFDAVVNHGNLCVKGRFGYDFIYNKDRVTTPLIRKNSAVARRAHAGLRSRPVARSLVGRSSRLHRRSHGGNLQA